MSEKQMTTTTNQTEANAKIAEWLGWRKVNAFQWTDQSPRATRLPKQWIDHDDLPNYFSPDLPIRERLEMLEALTERELDSLCGRVPVGGDDNWVKCVRTALKLDQPTFARLFCQIKSIKISESEDAAKT